MMKNRKKIAVVAIAALVVLALIMSAVLRGCSQEEQQDPTSSTDISQSENKQPNDVTTKPGEVTKPGETTKPGGEVHDTTPNETDPPETNSNKPGETEKPGTGVEDPGTTSTTQPVKKTEPENGVDYTIPTNLRGIAGNKLSTVSLGDSNLVWLNPDEKLSTNKSQYEAKFEETSTKNEKVVTVMVTVCKETPMERTDYTVPTNLKGIVGDKLSTVSLGDSNLIWVNPDETLSTNKSQYKAMFEETDTMIQLTINVTVEVSKLTPVKGTDYTVPTNLKGIVGGKLSTVSLGDSNLIWVNPDETLSTNKSQYKAMFEETDTMIQLTINVTVEVSKLTPVKGTDYTVPTNLRGTAGSKLSTVSLGNSHLVWVKPNETLSIQKTEYEAKFVETDTMKEVTVMVKVTVQRAPSDDDDHGGGGSGGTTNPPVNPVDPDNPTVNPDNPTVNPDNPTVNPDNPTVNPDNPTVNPDNPTVNPDNPTVNPDGPTVNPDGPTVNPDGPTVNPDGPTVNPDGPTVNPDGPTVNPDGPTVNPDGPTVNPDSPTVNPDGPTVNPDGPTVNPDGPTVNPDAPTVSDGPMVNPDGPMVNPDVPAVNLDALLVIPEVPKIEIQE